MAFVLNKPSQHARIFTDWVPSEGPNRSSSPLPHPCLSCRCFPAVFTIGKRGKKEQNQFSIQKIAENFLPKVPERNQFARQSQKNLEINSLLHNDDSNQQEKRTSCPAYKAELVEVVTESSLLLRAQTNLASKTKQVWA